MVSSKFVLALIGTNSYIEGATRLQKYGFLCYKTIKGITNYGFYEDWKASDYGPYSPSLATDLKKAIDEKLVDKFVIKNAYGYPVDRFALTVKGQQLVEDLANENKSLYKQIRSVAEMYHNKSLAELLHDVYYQFPQYAVNSKIKAEVGKNIYETDSYLSAMYDTPDSEDQDPAL